VGDATRMSAGQARRPRRVLFKAAAALTCDCQRTVETLSMSEEHTPGSCYWVSEGQLVPLRPELEEPDPLAVLIHSQFRGMILSPAFPCLGGTGAVRRGDYRFAVYGPLGSDEAIWQCASDLAQFLVESPPHSNPVAVFVVAFHGPLIATEAGFEASLWQHLRGIHRLDPWLEATQCENRETEDGDPGFFFGDRDFFIVGLHPASSRWARRFGWPILVFNALTHSDQLRISGKYDRMREKILARDHRLQGIDNPSLSFSQISQFSGRGVGADWQCPVKFK
jgi:FPC/CPF motif-containing protein YcgG